MQNQKEVQVEAQSKPQVEAQSKPQVEAQRKPISLDSDEIQKIIPHRYPMLLVDKIVDMEPGAWAHGVKCVSANEMIFCGHFPQKHIFPGVLIMEALAQVGAVAVLSEPENRGKIAVFGGIKNCRFKEQVKPGDVMELKCTLTDRRGPIGYGLGEAYVGGKLAAKGELTFVITD